MSSVTEVFDVGEGVPGLGSFSVDFRAGTEHVLGASVAPIDGVHFGGAVHNWRRCHLAITPGKLGANPTASTVLAASIFTGTITEFGFGAEGEQWSIGGPSALVWLGTADSIGPGLGRLHYREGAEYTGTFADYLLALIVGGWVNGIGLDATATGIDSAALNLPINGYDVVRDRINKLCRSTSPVTEYAFLPSLKCVFAPIDDTAGQVFTWDPTVIIGARGMPAGNENGLRGFPAEMRPSFSYLSEAGSAMWTRREWIEDSSWTGSIGSSGNVGGRVDYDATGSATNDAFEQLIGTSAETMNAVGRTLGYSAVRRDRLEVEIPDAAALRTFLKPGDHVWVEDTFHGIADPANTVRYGGRHRHPRKMRVASMSYPITKAMGAYVIQCIDGSNGVIPVHDLINPGSGGVGVGVATTSPPSIRSAALGSTHRPSWSDVQ